MLLASASYLPCQSSIPYLELNKNRFDFGNVKYMDEKFDVLKLKNTGDSVMIITKIDPFVKPFNSKLTSPLNINPKDSALFYVTYKPIHAGKDSIRVNFEANTRVSHSIGLLIDVSRSMNDPLPNGGNQKLSTANKAVSAFIDDMLNTNYAIDEAGIYTFSTIFTNRQDFTTEKSLLKNALPSSASGNTAFYDALYSTIDNVKNRKYEKVVIALTDGDDNSSKLRNPSSCINYAKANKVKVYIIGLGNNVTIGNTLKSIANSTGGEYYSGNTASEIVDIYHKIFKSFGEGYNSYIDLIGFTPAPEFIINCDTTIQKSPGDTLTYTFSLKNIYYQTGTKVPYKLHLSFNKTMLLPVDPTTRYLPDGTFEFSGVITESPDSVTLRTIRFVALLGDSNCTDLKVISVEWEDPYYPPLVVNESCRLCIFSCVRDLRQVQIFRKDRLSLSGQAGSDPSLIIEVENEGNFRLQIYNLMGSEVFRRDEKLGLGNHLLGISADLPTGTYICVLDTPTGRVIQKLVIVK